MAVPVCGAARRMGEEKVARLQQPLSRSFTVGSIDCAALLDGFEEVEPVQALFENAPAEDLVPSLGRCGLSWDGCLQATLTCLLIATERHRVLVDTGIGGLEPSGGRLVDALRDAGTEPGDIDRVVLSHAHADHISGNITDDGAPAFPNAEWVMHRAEWAFWMKSPLPETVPAFFRDVAKSQLQPIARHLTLVDDVTEIVPGVFAEPLPGHTPGHMVVSVRSAGEELIYAADAMLHPLQLEHPDWCAGEAIDMSWKQVAEGRRSICARAAEGHGLVLPYHFGPFPSLGRIRGERGTWRWEPTESEASW